VQKPRTRNSLNFYGARIALAKIRVIGLDLFRHIGQDHKNSIAVVIVGYISNALGELTYRPPT
jgi:hypothetical protein